MNDRAEPTSADLASDLWAVHEAGHAVIGLDLGMKILSVSIVAPDAGAADYAGFRPKLIHGKPATRALRTLEAYGQFCLAGPTAELWGDPSAFNLEDYVWPCKDGNTRLDEPWAQDVAEVIKIAAKIDIPNWFGYVALKTRTRVQHRWRAIEAVADALMQHKTLTEAELIEVAFARTQAYQRAR